MMRIQDLIGELNELRRGNPRKSSIDIYNLLENNRNLFLQKMDHDNFHHLHKSFEALSNAHSNEYHSASFKDEFQKNCGLLAFYLDKIL